MSLVLLLALLPGSVLAAEIMASGECGAVGRKGTFTVTATGTGTLTYQWQYSTNNSTWYNTSLAGYNTKTLTVTASGAVNGRYCRCIVTDSTGSVASAEAKFTVS